jgi:glycosyltransferase involved in cell wall biosynthesis
MNVLVAAVQSPFITGGAEVLAAGLLQALEAHGHRADMLQLPFFQRPLEQVVQSIHTARTIEIGESNFGAIDRLITIEFPAYYIDHPAKTLWLVHQYRQVTDLWNEPGIGFASLPMGDSVREAVSRADRLYLPQHRALLAISRTVADRLRQWSGLDAETLYPPLAEPSGYFCDAAGDYVVCPGRLSILKRQHLLLRALALMRAPLRARFFGGLDDAESLAGFSALARSLGVEERVEYLGWISEDEKRILYARSLGVVFVPRLEDLGLVVQEAMHSAKPIVTCADSGGVLEFVTDAENGVVTSPDPEALAEGLDRLCADRAWAAQLGGGGRERLHAMNLSWAAVVQRLLR